MLKSPYYHEISQAIQLLKKKKKLAKTVVVLRLLGFFNSVIMACRLLGTESLSQLHIFRLTSAKLDRYTNNFSPQNAGVPGWQLKEWLPDNMLHWIKSQIYKYPKHHNLFTIWSRKETIPYFRRGSLSASVSIERQQQQVLWRQSQQVSLLPVLLLKGRK